MQTYQALYLILGDSYGCILGQGAVLALGHHKTSRERVLELANEHLLIGISAVSTTPTTATTITAALVAATGTLLPLARQGAGGSWVEATATRYLGGGGWPSLANFARVVVD